MSLASLKKITKIQNSPKGELFDVNEARIIKQGIK